MPCIHNEEESPLNPPILGDARIPVPPILGDARTPVPPKLGGLGGLNAAPKAIASYI